MLSIHGVLSKEHFLEKSCGKYTTKASPRLLLIMVNSPKEIQHAINSL